jgi:hypothetical protein
MLSSGRLGLRVSWIAAPHDGRSGAGAELGMPPGPRGQPRATDDLTVSCWAGTLGESGRQADEANRRWAGARTEGEWAEAEAAAVAEVIASIATTPKATVAKALAYLGGRNREPKPLDVITAHPPNVLT